MFFPTWKTPFFLPGAAAAHVRRFRGSVNLRITCASMDQDNICASRRIAKELLAPTSCESRWHRWARNFAALSIVQTKFGLCKTHNHVSITTICIAARCAAFEPLSFLAFGKNWFGAPAVTQATRSAKNC